MPSTGMGSGRALTSLTIRVVLVGLGLLAAASCRPANDDDSSAPIAAPGVAEEGSFSMSLTLSGPFQFATVGYDVSGNGFHKAGSIDVAGSSVLSTVIGGIPLGTGYALQLAARDVDNQLTPCVGSTSFNVTSAATVAVPVHLTCRQVTSATPSVPVPWWARVALAALFLGLGARLVRSRRA